jgi:hypothetical protein
LSTPSVSARSERSVYGKVSSFGDSDALRRARIATAVGEQALPPLSDEYLVPDARAGVTPAEMVDRKLRALLKGEFFLASHLRHAATRRPGSA